MKTLTISSLCNQCRLEGKEVLFLSDTIKDNQPRLEGREVLFLLEDDGSGKSGLMQYDPSHDGGVENACLGDDREKVEASESEVSTRVVKIHLQEENPDAVSHMGQLKSQDQYQATYDDGEPDQELPVLHHEGGGKVVATVEYDLGEEDIMKLLTFAFAIHIMKGGIYEAYGLGKKKNLTMVPVESVVEKAAQGVVVYPEATDGDGEPIKGENMEELSPRALLVGKPGLEVEECGSLRCSPHLPAPGPTDIEQGVWKHHEVHTVCGVDYVKANPPDLAVLTCEVKSLPGLRDTTGAVESTLLALSVLRLGPLMLPSLMTKDYEVYECGVDYIKANPPDLAVLTCDAKSLPGLRIHLVEEIVSANYGVLIYIHIYLGLIAKQVGEARDIVRHAGFGVSSMNLLTWLHT